MANPHVGDVGTKFITTIVDQDGDVIDLSGAITKELLFKKPKSKGTLVKTAVFPLNGDGTDGKIQYISVVGDLDTSGDWKIQGYAETPDGNWSTEQEVFTVDANIKRP